MKKEVCLGIISSLILLLFLCVLGEAQMCMPSGTLTGTKPPPGECNTENDSECCVEGKLYDTYECSPTASTGSIPAIMTLNGFQNGSDGGGASKCDEQFHFDQELVVALWTGWINGGRCLKNIRIIGNGESVVVMVVDECDSTMGCDPVHAYQPPCRSNIVDATKAVWEKLRVPEDQWGQLDVIWTDA